MPTSNTKPQQSAATDSPLGAPGGNDPYQTVRAKNWAQEDQQSNGTPGNDIYATKRAGNFAQSETGKAEPKPGQGA